MRRALAALLVVALAAGAAARVPHFRCPTDGTKPTGKSFFVCEFVIGASGLGLTDGQIAAAQAADPRCQ